jgi:hypothetical protein
MTRYFGNQIRGKWRRPILDIASTLIKRRQICSQVDDIDIHETGSSLATILLCLEHQQRSESTLLVSWIDGQQTQVGPFTAKLDVDAAIELIAALSKQESALLEELLDLRLVDAWSIDEEAFDDLERDVDNTRDLGRVSGLSKTDRNSAHFFHAIGPIGLIKPI